MGTSLIFPVFLFSHKQLSNESCIWVWKGRQHRSQSLHRKVTCHLLPEEKSAWLLIKHGRNSQLPGLVAADTPNSTQHLFQVREKSLENTCASALPQSHLPATTLLSCLSTFKSAQDAAFLLHNKDLKPCILYTSGLLLWQAGDASRQQVQGWRVCLPSHKGRPRTGFPANPAATAWRPSCSL